jgi:hypothetical protein
LPALNKPPQYRSENHGAANSDASGSQHDKDRRNYHVLCAEVCVRSCTYSVVERYHNGGGITDRQQVSACEPGRILNRQPTGLGHENKVARGCFIADEQSAPVQARRPS